MAELPPLHVYAYFTTGVDGFTLDHPTRGQLDSATYTLAGDLPIDIVEDVEEVVFTRGRSRNLDEIPAGTGTIILSNPERDYDPFNTAGPYYGNLVPGKKVVVHTLFTIFTGYVADWIFHYDAQEISTASMLLEDGLALVGRMQFSTWTTTSQLPGARIEAVLDRAEVAWGAARDIDAGVEMLQADNVSFGSNVLNYLQLVNRSDHGRFYAAKDGVLTFVDRTHILDFGLTVEFADDGTGIPFANLQFESASDFLYNRVTVDREGGTAQTVTDTDSEDLNGRRPLELNGLLLNSDVQSLALANYLLNSYKEPEVRVASIDVDMVGLTQTEQGYIVGLEPGNLAQVTFTPDGLGSPIVQLSVVEGISHRITASSHDVTLSLGAAAGTVFFQLDHAVFGQLDSTYQLAF